MNILIDLLPTSVFIDGEEYEINTDFRIGILFEQLMQDKSLSDYQKLEGALSLYYPIVPHDKAKAIEAIMQFYQCGKNNEQVEDGSSNEKLQNDLSETSTKGPIYSYEYDADLFYSAFKEQYQIDLQDEDLHWWKFKALFKGLSEDTKLSKVMNFRSIEITNDMSDSEKKYYRKMKQIYRLPDNRTEEEKEQDFNEALSKLM